jgi:hypothetical protein
MRVLQPPPVRYEITARLQDEVPQLRLTFFDDRDADPARLLAIRRGT